MLIICDVRRAEGRSRARSRRQRRPAQSGIGVRQFYKVVIAELADGNAVKVVPVHAELTAQEAADLLNVSRPHLIKLLESNALPHHKTGKHRGVRFFDLMRYKAERDQARADAVEELSPQAQAFGMGYE